MSTKNTTKIFLTIIYLFLVTSNSSDTTIYNEVMVEIHCYVERQNHLEKTECSGQGASENSRIVNEVTQGGVSNMWHFFVKKFPFFLMLSWKVYLMAVNRLVNRTAPGIFKAFKETFQYYLHSEFRIKMVHMKSSGLLIFL